MQACALNGKNEYTGYCALVHSVRQRVSARRLGVRLQKIYYRLFSKITTGHVVGRPGRPSKLAKDGTIKPLLNNIEKITAQQ